MTNAEGHMGGLNPCCFSCTRCNNSRGGNAKIEQKQYGWNNLLTAARGQLYQTVAAVLVSSSSSVTEQSGSGQATGDIKDRSDLVSGS